MEDSPTSQSIFHMVDHYSMCANVRLSTCVMLEIIHNLVSYSVFCTLFCPLQNELGLM